MIIGNKHKFTVTGITQGKSRFYSCTIPSEILSRCCFVSARDDDPKMGFQRNLDEKRAQDIADYIDYGHGTIPCSIILSAQKESEAKIVAKGKTLEFIEHPKAFMILDGQHRVYGFSKAKSNIRVPVVIYNNLNRKEESRLFIDINSKQRGVTNELLLDIKQLAEYENDQEEVMREVFDIFKDESDSIFKNKLSPSKRSAGKLTRVTFNKGLTPLLSVFIDKSSFEIYETLNSYLNAFNDGLSERGCSNVILTAIVFRSILNFFPTVASKVKDRYGNEYTYDHFYEVMSLMFSKLKVSKLKKPGGSIKELVKHFEESFKSEFTL